MLTSIRLPWHTTTAMGIIETARNFYCLLAVSLANLAAVKESRHVGPSNATSTPRPKPRCRSRAGSPPTKNSSRRRRRRSRKKYEARLQAISDEAAKEQGMQPRAASCAPAAAWRRRWSALNQVFGNCYDVQRRRGRRTSRPSPRRWPKNQFIFDVQTHHVDVSRKWYENTDEGKAHRARSSGCCGRRPASSQAAWSCSTAPTTSRKSSATATR